VGTVTADTRSHAAGSQQPRGFAQIGVDATSPQTYAAGALLANGARLTEIYSRYVVLERDGRSAQLYVQGESRGNRGPRMSLLTVGGITPLAQKLPKSEDRLFEYLRPSPVFARRLVLLGHPSIRVAESGSHLQRNAGLGQKTGVAVTEDVERDGGLNLGVEDGPRASRGVGVRAPSLIRRLA
jgi:hypothetical protein